MYLWLVSAAKQVSMWTSEDMTNKTQLLLIQTQRSHMNQQLEEKAHNKIKNKF